MKSCSVCHIPKSLEEFNKRRYSSDGYRSECRECQHKAHQAYYYIGGGKNLKEQYYLVHREELLPRLRLHSGPTHYNPETAPAHKAVLQALHQGTLVRPSNCENCSIPCKPQAHHHHGYDEEYHLDIIWLCIPCHSLADNSGFASRLKENNNEHP